MKNPLRVGLALSGGQLKAAAHIGVIEALEKVGIQPDVMAGTSAGSLVTALYAHGYRTEQFKSLLDNFPGTKLLDYGFPLWTSAWSLALRQIHVRRSPKVPYVPPGILRGQKLIRYIERLLENRKAQMPFYIVATDLLTGSPVVFSNQAINPSDTYRHFTNLPKSIVGSCALPGIFTPVPLDDHLLVDGAMRDYVPISVLDSTGCDKIIAVNLYRLPNHYKPRTLVDVLARSFDILLRESIENDIVASSKTFLLEPDFSEIRWKTFSQMKKCYNIGHETVHQKRTEILHFLSTNQKKAL